VRDAPTRTGRTVMRIALGLIASLSVAVVVGASEQSQAPSAQKPTDVLARGKRLFESRCARCHGIQGAGGTGANLRRPLLRRAPDDESLFSVIKEGVPGTAMTGTWFMTEREIRDVAVYVRSLGRTPSKPPPGDPKLGKLAYEKGECAKCHIVRGSGGSVGPDLTDIGARRGPEFLRIAVLHPGQEMPLDAKGYTAYLVVVAVTDEGRVLTGTRVNEDTFTIQLRDENNRLHSLRKSDLELLEKTERSLMPSYEQTLGPAELDHLIAYLASLRGKP
jgi:cytochrome c oxidase cbb3-type subunit 3